MKNYYEILEVNKNASTETISKVYKFFAKKYHPDKNPNNIEEAEEKFKEISEAYEILSDKEKRKQYDIELEEYEKNNSAQSVSLEDFVELKNYCKQLENTIEQFNSPKSESVQYINNAEEDLTNNYHDYKSPSKAFEDAINRAYQDAYITSLKNMGYKIKYKKTFKEQVKNFFSLLIFIIILYILFKIIWIVPSLKNLFLSLFKI